MKGSELIKLPNQHFQNLCNGYFGLGYTSQNFLIRRLFFFIFVSFTTALKINKCFTISCPNLSWRSRWGQKQLLCQLDHIHWLNNSNDSRANYGKELWSYLRCLHLEEFEPDSSKRWPVCPDCAIFESSWKKIHLQK